MKRIRFDLVAGLSLMLAGSAPANSEIPAQPLADTRPAIKETNEQVCYSLIPIKNVTPSMMAWWIDPQHNRKPAELVNERAEVGVAQPEYSPRGRAGKTGRGTAMNGATSPEGALGLPPGVDSVIAVDPQKKLLVLGTAGGLQQLKKIVETLDKPFYRISLEVRAVEIEDDDVKSLGLKYDMSSGVLTQNLTEKMPGLKSTWLPQGTFSIAAAPVDFRDRLAVLEKPGKAKIIYTGDFPSLVSSSVSSSSTVNRLPVGDAAQDKTGAFKLAAELSRDKPNAPFAVANVHSFNVVPTVNNDGSVTLLMHISDTLQLVTDRIEDQIPLQTLAQLTSILNIKENDTEAILGFFNDTALSDLASGDAKIAAAVKPPRRVIWFLTVRKVFGGPEKLAVLPR